MINFSADHVFSFHIHSFYLILCNGYTWKFLCVAVLQLLENGLWAKQFVLILIHIILISLLTLRFSFQ